MHLKPSFSNSSGVIENSMLFSGLRSSTVTLTNGWSDNWEWEGKPFPFSKDNAELFFRELPEYAAWATHKVTQRLNFMRGWSKK